MTKKAILPSARSQCRPQHYQRQLSRSWRFDVAMEFVSSSCGAPRPLVLRSPFGVVRRYRCAADRWSSQLRVPVLWTPLEVVDELLRENKCMLDNLIREIERERQSLQSQEFWKLITEIKKTAKQAQMGAVRMMAKDLIRAHYKIVRL